MARARTTRASAQRIAQPPGLAPLAPLPPEPAFTQARLDFAAASYPDSLEARFRAYDARNPDVFREFRAIAERLYAAGVKHYGAGAIYEVMRYERTIRGYDPDCPDVGLNNSYRSRFARKLVEEDRDRWAGFFSFRKLKSA